MGTADLNQERRDAAVALAAILATPAPVPDADPYAELKAAFEAGKTIEYFDQHKGVWNKSRATDIFRWTMPVEKYRIAGELDAEQPATPTADAIASLAEACASDSETGQHAPGVKLDHGKSRAGMVLGGFARALTAVSDVGTFGAKKYTPHGWRSVPHGVERYTDAMMRHQLAEAAGEQFDAESGLPHAAHAAWNALARLELLLSQRTPFDDEAV